MLVVWSETVLYDLEEFCLSNFTDEGKNRKIKGSKCLNILGYHIYNGFLLYRGPYLLTGKCKILSLKICNDEKAYYSPVFKNFHIHAAILFTSQVATVTAV